MNRPLAFAAAILASAISVSSACIATPGRPTAFISEFGQLGYSNLPVDTLVEIKALDVTPDYIRSLQTHGLMPRSADQLVELEAVGVRDPDTSK